MDETQFAQSITENFTPGDAAANQAGFIASVAENIVSADGNNVFGWVTIVDTQNSNWNTINDTQTPGWSAINNTQG